MARDGSEEPGAQFEQGETEPMNERAAMALSGLEILDRLLLGHTAFHRRPDAWDLIDSEGRVVAVLCPRQHHVSIAPTKSLPTPHPGANIVPYKEKVAEKITADRLDEGIALVAELAAPRSRQSEQRPARR